MSTYNRKELMSFAGVQPSCNLITWKKKWSEIYHDDGCLILAFNGLFAQNGDENLPDFEYRYILKAMDLQAFGSDQTTIALQLFMCPLPQYIIPERRKAIMNEESDNEEYFFEDAADQGILPCVGTEYLNYKPEDIPEDEHGNKWYDYFYDVLKHPQMETMLDTITTCIYVLDEQRGYWLDDVFNQIGTSGWDLLYDLLTGKDWLKASIDRLKEYSKGE